jgi:hypothetical protein
MVSLSHRTWEARKISSFSQNVNGKCKLFAQKRIILHLQQVGYIEMFRILLEIRNPT